MKRKKMMRNPRPTFLRFMYFLRGENMGYEMLHEHVPTTPWGCYANRAFENSNLFRKIAQNTMEKDISTTG